MWPKEFQDRLREWVNLRTYCQQPNLSTEQILTSINSWWMKSPWRPYYLHWDDRSEWPNPWDLLADNCFCDLARALGIVYTVLLVDDPRLKSVSVAETDRGNLVLVDQGKYILNWSDDQVLNIASQEFKISRTVDGSSLQHLIG